VVVGLLLLCWYPQPTAGGRVRSWLTLCGRHKHSLAWSLISSWYRNVTDRDDDCTIEKVSVWQSLMNWNERRLDVGDDVHQHATRWVMWSLDVVVWGSKVLATRRAGMSMVSYNLFQAWAEWDKKIHVQTNYCSSQHLGLVSSFPEISAASSDVV